MWRAAFSRANEVAAPARTGWPDPRALDAVPYAAVERVTARWDEQGEEQSMLHSGLAHAVPCGAQLAELPAFAISERGATRHTGARRAARHTKSGRPKTGKMRGRRQSRVSRRTTRRRRQFRLRPSRGSSPRAVPSCERRHRARPGASSEASRLRVVVAGLHRLVRGRVLVTLA